MKVADERMLVVRIRRAGRKELISRLRQRLGVNTKQLPHAVRQRSKEAAATGNRPAAAASPATEYAPASPHRLNQAWIYAVAAAACVVIVTGVGILNQWGSHEQQIFKSSEQDVVVTTPPPVSPAGQSAHGPNTNTAGKRSETPEKVAIPSQIQPPSTPASENALSTPVMKEKQEMEYAVAPPEAADRAGEKDVRNFPKAAGAGFDLEGSWVEGETVDAKTSILRSRVDRGVMGQPGARIDATFAQAPFDDAPLRLQEQRAQQGQTVLTFVQQAGETLRLTLYPDSQLNERDLRQAQAYRLTADSIIVILPSQSIRYRIQAPATQRVR